MLCGTPNVLPACVQSNNKQRLRRAQQEESYCSVFLTVSLQASRRVSRRLSHSRALRRSLRAVFRQSVTHSCSVFTFLRIMPSHHMFASSKADRNS